MYFSSRISALLALSDGPAREKDVHIATNTIRCLDLTSLRGDENAAEITDLCARAKAAGCAAVCVYPDFVSAVATHVRGTDVRCASVAMGFPDARGTLAARLAEIDRARRAGADEIDIVVPTALVLEHDWAQLGDILDAARTRCDDAQRGDAQLKVILETGVLPEAKTIYQSARCALDHGADFVKTSTGKVDVGATLEAAAAMVLAIDDHGHSRGLKLSGGIRTLADVRPYYRMLSSHWGDAALEPSRVRIGASSLLASLEETIRNGGG